MFKPLGLLRRARFVRGPTTDLQNGIDHLTASTTSFGGSVAVTSGLDA
jgi:hypothetical protein